jgi:hypothetical protein
MKEEDEPEIPTLTASPDAETTILFTSHPEQGMYWLQNKVKAGNILLSPSKF